MKRKLTHLIAAGGLTLACAATASAQPDEPMPFVAPDDADEAFAQQYDQAMQSVSGQVVDAQAYLLFGRAIATDPADTRAALHAGRALALVTEADEAYLILRRRDAETVQPFVAPEVRREPERVRPRSPIREAGQSRASVSPRAVERIRQQRPLLGWFTREREPEPADEDEIEPFIEPEEDEPAWQPVDPEDFEPAPMVEPGQQRAPGNPTRIREPGQRLELSGAVFERGGVRAIVIEGYEVDVPGEARPRVD